MSRRTTRRWELLLALAAVLATARCAAIGPVSNPADVPDPPVAGASTGPEAPSVTLSLSASPTATTAAPAPASASTWTVPPPASPTPTPTPSRLPSMGPEAAIEEQVAEALAALRDDEARVGQLLMVGWSGGNAASARDPIETLHPGAIVFIQNTHEAAQARRITEGLRRIAHGTGMIPLLISVDHEGGIVQRIRDVPNLGSNRAFALTSPSTEDACLRGREHAEQLHEMGFSLDLAPVLDVNTNPDNPVIGDRSYGADPRLVARLGAAYVRGLQAGDGGLVAVGKHFPGHGDTSVDSHLDLPVLPFGMDRLDRVELVPFRRAMEPDTRIAAIMTAHISLPQLDHSGRPATLSRPVVTGLLRERLGFDGLVISDDLAAMQAITDRYSPGEAAVGAITAGVDMLIIGGDLDRQHAARDALLDALGTGALSRERLGEALRHVLTVKARFGILAGREDEPLPPADCAG